MNKFGEEKGSKEIIEPGMAKFNRPEEEVGLIEFGKHLKQEDVI